MNNFPKYLRPVRHEHCGVLKWRAKYGAMDVSMILRVKELFEEYCGLKKIFLEEKLKLKRIISWRGKPEVIRCDNGPEYISNAIQGRAKDRGIRLENI